MESRQLRRDAARRPHREFRRMGLLKRISRVVSEGSVLISPAAPRGSAVNVAPEGFPHPVYRYGYALSISIPMKGGTL